MTKRRSVEMMDRLFVIHYTRADHRFAPARKNFGFKILYAATQMTTLTRDPLAVASPMGNNVSGNIRDVR